MHELGTGQLERRRHALVGQQGLFRSGDRLATPASGHLHLGLAAGGDGQQIRVGGDRGSLLHVGQQLAGAVDRADGQRGLDLVGVEGEPCRFPHSHPAESQN